MLVPPAGSSESQALSHECQVCHSHHCEQAALMSALWLCQTRQRALPTKHDEHHQSINIKNNKLLFRKLS